MWPAVTSGCRPSVVFPWSSLVILIVCCVWKMEVSTAEEMKSCPPEKLQKCLNMAYTYLENDRFTFPTTKADVEDVCRSWSEFLDCIELYVAECLDERQKSDFKQAVGSILDSVRNLCSDPDYQEQYFQHADCIKRTCTDDAYCGRYYKQMTRQVSQEFDTNDLCCNYRRFESCVVANTHAICGSTARDFASSMLNKSMSFLAARCKSGSSPTSERCADANEIAAGPTFAVTGMPPAAGPSSRAMPVASSGGASTPASTKSGAVTKGPESLAYENSSTSLYAAAKYPLVTCSILFSFYLKLSLM